VVRRPYWDRRPLLALVRFQEGHGHPQGARKCVDHHLGWSGQDVTNRNSADDQYSRLRVLLWLHVFRHGPWTSVVTYSLAVLKPNRSVQLIGDQDVSDPFETLPSVGSCSPSLIRYFQELLERHRAGDELPAYADARRLIKQSIRQGCGNPGVPTVLGPEQVGTLRAGLGRCTRTRHQDA
jgi:hypothetical protein